MNEIVTADVAHIERIVRRMRGQDVDEITKLTDWSTEGALLLSFTMSTECYTWMRGGHPIAVFGVAPDPDQPGVGCPWFLGTDEVRDDVRFFLMNSRKFVLRFNELYPLLENYIDPANTLSLRYLRWCGFKFDSPEPYGPHGELATPFYKEASHVSG